MTIFLSFIVTLLLIALAKANVGIFAGYGSSVKLASSEDIQLVSEEVTITPGRGKFLFDGTYAGLDQVEYLCRFKLRNLKNTKVNAQVGFPLNTWRHAQRVEPIHNINQETMEFISRYQFIVQEEGHIYTVRYLREDQDEKYEDLFLWTAPFEPNEEKLLQVNYSMPISTGPDFNWGLNCEKKWYYWLESINVEWFGYVTETGKSWKGKITEAEFSIFTRGFEEYLRHRIGSVSERFKENGEKIEAEPVWRPVIHRVVKPEGWEEDTEGFIRWVFKDYEPKEPIKVEYHFFGIPQNADDTIRLLRWISEENGSLNQEDIEDIEDIIKAYHGYQIENARVKSFLENQMWYPRMEKSKMPHEVLEVLEEYKNKGG